MQSTITRSEAGRVSLGEKIGYALGDTASNLVWRTMIVFIPIFYTDVFGLTAAAVGTLLLICRVWDGVSDIAMGVVADRTETRWGKFRPWILWTAVPFGITTVLTFITPDLSYNGKLAYAYITYSALILVYTASNIPYSALTGVMSPSPEERTSISSYRFVFAFLGGLITQGLNLYLVRFFGGGDNVKGYKYTMMLFAALAVVLFLITFFTTKERVKAPREMTSLGKDLRDLMNNGPWKILFGLGLLFVTFTTLKGGVQLYYFKYLVGSEESAAGFMIAGLLAAMLGAALTAPLTKRLGKRNLMIFSLLLAAVTSFLLYFTPPTNLTMLYVLSSLTEFATGPIVTLFFAMLADAADYSEWKKGRRATALTFSAGTFSMKFGTGIAGALTGWLLDLFGYIPNVAQSEQSLHGIRLLISILPAIAITIAAVLFMFYKLDGKVLDQMQGDLAARRVEAGA